MQPLYPNRINWQNLPSFDTPLGASNLNKMDYAIYGLDQRVLTLTGYQDSASQSAKNAKASEVSAKTSELNASASEEMARQYAEQAFSGTPEGYEQLVENVRLMDIQTTTDTTLADSKAGGYKLVSMSGNSVQNGTPTPDYPVAINNVADCVEIVKGDYGNSVGEYRPQTNGYICSKNPIPCKSGDVITIKLESANNGWFYFYNKSGLIAIQKVEDNTTISKIATEGATHFTFVIGNSSTTLDNVGKITLTINGKYVLQIKGHGKNFFSYDKDTTTLVKASVRYKTISTSKKVVLKAGTYNLIMSDLVVANNTKPLAARLLDNMGVAIASNIAMQKKDNIYIAKFTANSDSLLSSLYLFLDTNDNDNATATFSEIMIVEDNVTDYTFEEYKETVATILLNAPLCDTDVMNRAEVNRKFASVVYDGSDDENFTLNASIPNAFSILPNGMKKGAKVLCTHYKQYSSVAGVDFGMTTGTYLNFINVNCSTVAEFKATLQENPIEVVYELAEPLIEELDAASQIALNSLETFDTVTYIAVDSRTPPSEINSEYGTSIVGARTLKNELRNDTLEIKYNELAVALVATE